jgi:hypothetical protein
MVELAVVGAFGTLSVGAVLAEAVEFVPVTLAAFLVAAAALALRRRRRRGARLPHPVPLPMPVHRADVEGEGDREAANAGGPVGPPSARTPGRLSAS